MIRSAASLHLILFLTFITVNLYAGTIVLQEGHSSAVDCVNFTPDGKNIISSGYDESIIVWSTDGRLIRKNISPKNAVLNLDFSADGKYLFISDAYTSLRIVDPETFNNVMSVFEKYKDYSIAAIHPS